MNFLTELLCLHVSVKTPSLQSRPLEDGFGAQAPSWHHTEYLALLEQGPRDSGVCNLPPAVHKICFWGVRNLESRLLGQPAWQTVSTL